MAGTEAYIVAATRTPVGRRNGGLAAAHPADLAAHVLVEALSRAAVDADAVDDVIMGCGPGSVMSSCTRSPGRS